MRDLPTRKPLRIPGYDYSTPGSYFVTICTQNREALFWDATSVYEDLTDMVLSPEGSCVEREIQNLKTIYSAMTVDNYCIMPDHVHLLLTIHEANGAGEKRADLPNVINQFKGAISKQIGRPVWQKGYMERVIRNEVGYCKEWEYIDNNPRKYLLKKQEEL